jgi:hypothetical protein
MAAYLAEDGRQRERVQLAKPAVPVEKWSHGAADAKHLKKRAEAFFYTALRTFHIIS